MVDNKQTASRHDVNTYLALIMLASFSVIAWFAGCQGRADQNEKSASQTDKTPMYKTVTAREQAVQVLRENGILDMANEEDALRVMGEIIADTQKSEQTAEQKDVKKTDPMSTPPEADNDQTGIDVNQGLEQAELRLAKVLGWDCGQPPMLYEGQTQGAICQSYLLKAQQPTHENNKPFIYICSSGCLTTGIGYNVDSWEVFRLLNFEKEDGTFMSMVEKRELYDKCIATRDELKRKNGQDSFKKYKADHYENMFIRPTARSIRLVGQYCSNRSFNDLETCFQACGVSSHCFSVDQAQCGNTGYYGIFDLEYNMGATRFCPDRWPNLFYSLLSAVKAYARGDMACYKACIRNAAEESERKTLSDARNKDTYDCIISGIKTGLNQEWVSQIDMKKLDAKLEELRHHPLIKEKTLKAARPTVSLSQLDQQLSNKKVSSL